MQARSFDHVALWVTGRDRISDFLCEYLGLHVIERTDAFTLVGADAREGKLTLFDAEGPRDRGQLERVVLRVPDLSTALRRLPGDLRVDRVDSVASFYGPHRIPLGLLQEDKGLEYDLDSVVLRVPDPERTAAELAGLGFGLLDGHLSVAGRCLRLEEGDAADPSRPLLNHLALLVDSARDHLEEAQRRGLEVEDLKDAPNTLAVFIRGPDGIRLEYVEHKPGFSLT